MKKIINRQFTDEEKKYIKLNRRLTLIRYFLLIGFLLVFNVFAWFIYVSRVRTEIDMHVLSWNITFSVDNTSIREINLLVDIYPGMEDYTHTVKITNGSETSAKLRFETDSVKLFGRELTLPTETEEQKENNLENNYPFQVLFTSTSNEIGVENEAEFTIQIKWEYEADKYFKVLNVFDYDDELTYYVNNNGTYVEDTTVTSANYNSKKDTLYLIKDDADSYIGEKCGRYVRENNQNCLQISGNLIAEQA